MTRYHCLPLILLLASAAACTAPDRGSEPAADAPTGAGAADAMETDAPDAADDATDTETAAVDHLRARGNEPFWAIDVEGNVLHFVTPEMPEGRTLESERIEHDRGVAFTGEDEGRPYSLDITDTACTDSMSGEAFESTATWDYDGQRMHGCAYRGNRPPSRL
ncbi:hypothetical protein [Luteimonas lutimaris]|uniref:Uncharacterized protein n=1 Tax=Luteimonas lutimaris TaxID=698645 RepID=A0ABP7MHD2_9GAMM